MCAYCIELKALTGSWIERRNNIDRLILGSKRGEEVLRGSYANLSNDNFICWHSCLLKPSYPLLLCRSDGLFSLLLSS